jgi:hypothetical protein
MNAASRCVVLVPVSKYIEPETEKSLTELARRGYKVRTLRGSSQVDLARSLLATESIRDGYAETMWIDADVAFDPDDVEKLRAHNRPFTAGLYVKKGPKEFAGKFRPGTKSVTLGVGGGLLEVEYVGMGFTHMRAEVYTKIASGLGLPSCGGGYDPAKLVTPYFLPLLVPTAEGWDYLSEDYSFCYRARQVGIPVFADTTIRLGHVGSYTYGWEELAAREKFESVQLGIAQPGAG